MILDQLQLLHTDSNSTVTNSSLWYAQTFTAGITGFLNKVILYASSNDVSKPTNPDLIVEIRTTLAGSPTSTVLASQTVLWANVPSETADSFNVIFSSPPTLEFGVKYAIVMYPSPQGTSGAEINQFAVWCGWNNYANGNLNESTDNINWSEWELHDFYFQTYMTPIILKDINTDIRTVPYHTIFKDLNCDIRINQEVLSDISTDIRTIPYHTVFKDINCDIRVNKENTSDINCSIITVDKVISDVNCDIRVNSADVFSNINCDIRVKADPLHLKDVNCDIRVRAIGDVGPTPIGLEGFKVYLDGDEITDVQIDSIQYEWTANEAPSTASFRIVRKSDDFNKTLDEISQAIINNTPIQIKFNDKLHWHGYISYPTVNQAGESVIINCVDRKYKIQEKLYSGSCGRKWESDGSIMSGSYLSTGSFLSSVLGNLVSSNIISSYSGNPSGIIQEYSETEGATAGSLITELLDLSGNYYWTVRPDGKLVITPAANGTIKNLPSQTLTKQIHLYDILDYNIKLNDRSNLITSLQVEIGINETIKLDSWVSRRVYWYAKSAGLARNVYQRINPTSQYIPGANFDTIPTLLFWNGIGYSSLGIKAGGWYWNPAINTFYTTTHVFNVTSIGYGGIGATKQLKLSQLGVKPETWWNWYGSGIMWTTTRNGYDDSGYASDRASLLVSRTKDPITEGSIDLTFDAFEYYNIQIGDRINITSTNETDIYNGNNGFPLDVQSITFNPGDYKVTLHVKHLTDYIATTNFR